VGTATVQLGSYWTRAEWLAGYSRLAKFTKSQRVMTLWRLYVCDTLLERLAQDLQRVAAEFRQFIQEQNAIVRPRPL
jgi:hypothetical protein